MADEIKRMNVGSMAQKDYRPVDHQHLPAKTVGKGVDANPPDAGEATYPEKCSPKVPVPTPSVAIPLPPPASGAAQEQPNLPLPTLTTQVGGPKPGKAPKSLTGRCYEKHPPLPLRDGLVIYGGSCLTPLIDDADVYIGFDGGMRMSPRSWPWNPGHEVIYPIQDGQVPKNLGNFKTLIGWTIQQLEAGAKVHAGCIGGHGRTGTFFAALVRTMVGEEDAIAYVRKHYCPKVVESDVQVNWLHEHFGIKKQAPSKAHLGSGKSFGGGYGHGGQGAVPVYSGGLARDKAKPAGSKTIRHQREQFTMTNPDWFPTQKA